MLSLPKLDLYWLVSRGKKYRVQQYKSVCKSTDRLDPMQNDSETAENLYTLLISNTILVVSRNSYWFDEKFVNHEFWTTELILHLLGFFIF